jgi:hypothetical protein
MKATSMFRRASGIAVTLIFAAALIRAADHPRQWSRLIQAWGQPLSQDEPVKCGLPVIAHALRNQASLPADARAMLAGVLIRPETQTSIVAGNFRIHFDTTGANAPAFLDAQGKQIAGTARAYADSTGAALTYSLGIESGILGYPIPPKDGTLGGGQEYDVYIQDLGSMYGYTTPDGSSGAGALSTSFVTIDNDFAFVRPTTNRGLPALRVTVAHELHHAIQIGNYGYWDADVYFYEMTSTWLEDVVYPAVNDYYNYLTASWSHYRQPEKSFTSDDLIMYSRATWVHYLAKRFGVAAIKSCWEEIAKARPLRAMDVALRRYSSDLATALAEWARWNYFTGSRANPTRYYPDGADYPEIAQTPIEFVAPARDIPGVLEVVATKYYRVQWKSDSMTVILANVDVDASLEGSPTSFPYNYSFNTARVDDGYGMTLLGLYGKLSVSNVAMWVPWYVVGDSVRPYIDPATLEEGSPFPHPFRADGSRKVFIPVDVNQTTRGQLFVYTPSMTLIYQSPEALTTVYSGRQVFTWDGRTTSTEVAPSGIYVYVVELPDRRVTGKIALLRE